jgi:hypothetical protein
MVTGDDGADDLRAALGALQELAQHQRQADPVASLTAPDAPESALWPSDVGGPDLAAFGDLGRRIAQKAELRPGGQIGPKTGGAGAAAGQQDLTGLQGWELIRAIGQAVAPLTRRERKRFGVLVELCYGLYDVMRSAEADVTGQTFGRLTVTAEVESRAGHRQVEARCPCGRDVEVRLSHLRSGHTRSCGRCRRRTPDGRFVATPLPVGR